ncbi:MAG: M4 family metallopeptidase [Bacteroidales bacterium]|nr:M4 family metallopeptidase [Bacteroidales bacterium]
MKKLLLTLTLTFLFFQINAQVLKGHEAADIANGADIVRINDFTSVPDFIHFNNSTELSVEKAISYTLNFFDNEDLSLELKNIQNDAGSEQTYRFHQTYNGIPVEFSAWLIHFDGQKVFSMNGTLLEQIDVNRQFAIDEVAALEKALEYCNAESYMWEHVGEENLLKKFKGDNTATYFPTAEKVIVPTNAKFNKETTFRTAYKFDIYSKKPHNRRNIYVDAITGEILFEMSLLHVSDEIGTAQTVYSGERSINTEYTGSEYTLTDNTRGDGVKTLNCQMTIDYEAAIEFTDDDNYWDNVNQYYDEYATDAHFATMSTYDYYLNVHERSSIDGDGHPLWSFVHFNLIDYGLGSNTNAFWNGRWMTYGDGDPENGTTPLTTVDICAHEITHGLTSYTCNLNYQDESGALNEAFSDIFGASVEFYAAPDYADWTVGEDIGFAFRSLANPNATNKPDTYEGTYWVFGSEDNGGVHTNMSPLCYWYYLLCEGGSGTNDNNDVYSVSAIGIDKAEKIAFRLQTVYLTPSSQYHDAWFYAMQATTDLYGACSDEVQAVGDGFWAIGVADAPYVNEVHAGFVAGITENCKPPLEVQFNNQSYNGDNFLWDFGDGSTSTEINPTHIYTDYGFYDVELQVGGSTCGDDLVIKDNFVSIDPSLPCITFMPSSGNTLVENCNGIIYDIGGPDANYYSNTDASVTIYAPGSSSILLTIHEFDIEPGDGSECDYDYISFYNGSSTSSSQINSTNYCNTTGNPGTISSTGEYITIRFHSDPGLNLAGFKIQYDCINNEMPPTPYFSANKESTCDGEIQFTDNSFNFPTSWNWEFGDGNTSNEQNPKHFYEQNGTYTVSLTGTNEYGSNTLTKTDYIIVNMTETPTIGSIQACSDTPFDIEVDLQGEAYWYINTQDETPEHIGNNWNHSLISEPTTYYLREVFAGEEFNIGATNNTYGGGYFGNPNAIHYLIFDTYTPFILESVEVNADGAGNRAIALRNSSQQIIEQKTVYCPDGVSRIDINFDIPVGENLQLVGLGSPNLFRTNVSSFLNYPYTVENIISIKESSAGTEPTDYYYYFYDWQISTPTCKSPFVEINLIPETCTTNIADNILDNISLSPNPTNDIFRIYGIENLSDINIKITDITGKVVYEKNLSNDNIVNISNYSPGVYFISVNSDLGNKTLKIIKN